MTLVKDFKYLKHSHYLQNTAPSLSDTGPVAGYFLKSFHIHTSLLAASMATSTVPSDFKPSRAGNLEGEVNALIFFGLVSMSP